MNLFLDEEAEKYYSYAFAHYHSGHWSEAADAFRVLCTKRPLESKFWFGLGATLQAAESYEEALHSWAMAALLKKEDPYPHFHAAECYLSLQIKKDAALALSESEKRIQDMAHPLIQKIQLLKSQWSLKNDYFSS